MILFNVQQRSTIALAFPILLNFVYIVKCCTIRKVLKRWLDFEYDILLFTIDISSCPI